MKKLCLVFIILCSGCSVIQPVEHSAPTIQFNNDKYYLTDRSDESLQSYYVVKDEEDVEVEVTTSLTENGKLCISAVNEYEKSTSACQQYQIYDLDFDYDYENESLETILKRYLQEHQIEDDVYYFYYNPVTQKEIQYRENEIFPAASTIKVAMCMGWTNLIHEGRLSEDTTLYFDPSFYEISGVDLTEFYPFGSQVPISAVMENSIVYSDNSCANMMWAYYPRYADETYREWLSHFSPTPVNSNFYYSNDTTVGLMLNVMKKLYENQELYKNIIDDMKIAAKGEYLQANTYPFEISQKYGLYEEYQHAMGIMFTKQPICVGIFTELANFDAEQVIADLSKIMVEYTIVHS